MPTKAPAKKKPVASRPVARTTKSKKKSGLFARQPRLITLIIFVVVFGGLGAWRLAASHALTATGINTADRDTVNSTYKSMWAANLNVTSGWTGSVSTCRAGNISEAARLAQVNAVNFARRLNDLAPVGAARLTDQVQANVQQAALIQDANLDTKGLSHSPTSSSRCYTAAGATTSGKSNLAASYGSIKPVQAIELYLNEPGASNVEVGHRNWIFNPDATVFGFGMTARAAATQVTGLRTDSTNNDPLWVEWPANGYFPASLEPAGRWSVFSRVTVDFSAATVTVTHAGSTYSPTIVSRGKHYVRPALVWQMPAETSRLGTYTVTIRGVKSTTGNAIAAHTYSVVLFTPY